MLQSQVDLAAFDDVPGLGLAVRSAKVLGREGDIRMGVYGKALAGVQQLDK